ncbi:MAG TPA: hypothetical protein VFB41_07445 [Solirubrobacteraceae bacterium]|nr:hypothetical protein [Solirubrobacteraceae bacterium]
MAIVYVEEFDVGDDRSTSNYDAVAGRLDVEANPPEGLIVHTAGFAGDQFRIVDVWETEEDKTRFYDGRVLPVVMQVMADATEGPPALPRTYSYEIHDLITG